MGPIATGTFIYMAITAMFLGFAWSSVATKRISKDAAQILSVIISLLGFFMWLIWLCTWLHQWHPLLTPTWKEAAEG
jgi:V-type H+-transporting ATPase subunit e